VTGFEDRLGRRLKHPDGEQFDLAVERVLEGAIRLGRRRWRRSLLRAGTAAVALLALAAVVAAAPQGTPHRPAADGPPAGRPGDGPVRFDLLVNGRILVAGGGTIGWPAAAGARPWFGYRVPAGWLVESIPAGTGTTGTDTIALVGTDGRLRSSHAGSGLTVSADGQMAAWLGEGEGAGAGGSTGGGWVVAGRVGGTALAKLALPYGGELLGFWHDRVMVARYPTSKHLNATVSLWDPARGGALSGSWTVPSGPRLVGASPDGRYPVVASRASRSGPVCLVELDPSAGLAVHASACPSGLDEPLVSPDGRWLTGLNSIGRADPVYDLAALFRGGRAAPVGTGCVDRAGNADLAWEDADTLVLVTPALAAGSTRLSAVRCRLGNGTAVPVHDPRLPATTGAAITLPEPTYAGPP
jgi:hypothetical protein